MQKVWRVTSLITVWIAVTTFALVWGFRSSWPDFVRVDYGLPLVWATNTLSTIAGPANTWQVNPSNLLADLIIWLGILDVVVALIMHFPNREPKQAMAPKSRAGP